LTLICECSLINSQFLVADNERNLALEREWSVTYAMLSRLLMYMEKIKELNERAEHERDPLRLWHLAQDADGIKLAVQARLNTVISINNNHFRISNHRPMLHLLIMFCDLPNP
jgi:hypothetical protein